MGLISEKKTEVLYAELNKKAEAATSCYSVTGDSLQYIYFVHVTKNHRNIQSRCLVQEFSLRYFWMLLIMVTEQLYQRNILCGCFHFIRLWLNSIMKRCTEWCAPQLYQTSLKQSDIPSHDLNEKSDIVFQYPNNFSYNNPFMSEAPCLSEELTGFFLSKKPPDVFFFTFY